MTNRSRGLCARLATASVVAAGVTVGGCGEPEPPPMSKEAFEATKAKQVDMLKKEYGLDKGGKK